MVNPVGKSTTADAFLFVVDSFLCILILTLKKALANNWEHHNVAYLSQEMITSLFLVYPDEKVVAVFPFGPLTAQKQHTI